MTAVFAIIKRLFASNKVSFIITAVVVLCATTSGESKIALSNGNYTWLLAVMTPFLFVFYDYTKLMHLGASKKAYFLGSLASYGLMAFVVSLANTAIYVLIDPLNRTQTVINMMDSCGWTANGVFVAFLQQTVFLLLTMIFLHVLLPSVDEGRHAPDAWKPRAGGVLALGLRQQTRGLRPCHHTVSMCLGSAGVLCRLAVSLARQTRKPYWRKATRITRPGAGPGGKEPCCTLSTEGSYAALLVWLADRWRIGGDYLYFYTHNTT